MADKQKKELAFLHLEKSNLVRKIEDLYKLIEIEDINASFLFKVRFQELDSDYTNFNDLQRSINKILINLGQEAELKQEQEEMKNIEEKYFQIMAANLQLNTSMDSHSHASINSYQPNVKLPTIDLPNFDGTLKNWPQFKDFFVSLVHKNDNLSNIEKFHYLVSSLKSEPLSLTKGLPMIAENYSIVWNLLVERYDNKRALAIHYLNEILNIPILKEESFRPIRQLVDLCTENVHALKSLQFPVDYGDFMLCHIVIQRLDPHTRQLFERKCSDVEFPTFDQLISFLKDHCKSLEACQPLPKSGAVNKPFTSNKFQKGFEKPSSQPFHPKNTFLSNVRSQICMYCEESHPIYRCQKFIDLSVSQRHDFIKIKQGCLNCLSHGHTAKSCKSNNSCRKCFRRHHTLLHYTTFDNASASTNKKQLISQTPQTSKEVPYVSTHTASQNMHPTIEEEQYYTLLGTAAIQLKNSNDEYKTYRALLDPGSQVSYISENCIRELNLSVEKYSESIQGISQIEVQSAKGIVRCCIKPRFKKQPCIKAKAIVLSSITSPLPSTPLPINVRKYFKDLELADPHFDVPGKIDFLLGADLFSDIFDGGQKRAPKGLPTAYSSIFGWILLGKTITKHVSPTNVSHLTVSQSKTLETAIKKFWEIEEPPHKIILSPEEECCEQHYEHNHCRDYTGRYVVRLPIKDPHPPLGNSEDLAKQRFFSLEKRFTFNHELKTTYTECMNEYIQSGHMEKIELASIENNEHFFLPHHAVQKSESSTTKTRVVFDASAKTSTGVSLNQILHSGPKLQIEISDILLDFRCFLIVFSCDIKKMFHQIRVHPDDRNYQLLFWREDKSQPLCVYRFTSVVFGFSSSPFLAIRTLKQLVKDEGKMYPLAAAAIEKQTYVDDLLLGANSLEEASTLQEETISLLDKGGFDLRKWKTNCPELVNYLPDDHKEKPLYFQNTEQAVYSFLGIKWIPKDDCFTFHIDIATQKAITKRSILSTVARIFDPCGWLTPITFWTKCLIQLLWSVGLQWDEPVPISIAEKWKKFLSQLPHVETIKIQRCLFLNTSPDIQLHGFSDASEAGYSATVYIRIVSSNNEVKTYLLYAKSKVAPLKKVSIPRLELCGAHLLAKLLSYCANIMSKHCHLKSITAWCDSTIVLSWIRTPPFRLKVYVANRVAQIQEWVPPHFWLHVPTNHNPADCASRGLLPDTLVEHQLWWTGPVWLNFPSEQWPQLDLPHLSEDSLPELKPLTLTSVATTTFSCDFTRKFSSWTTLIRVTSYILRFIRNCKKKDPEKYNTTSLTLNELNSATSLVCRLIQKEHFANELSALNNNEICSSRINRLDPFLDKEGLIRVGGRIKHSHIPYKAKYPILLPKKSHLTNMIVDYFHLKYLHCGPQFLQATLSQTFWILSARTVIRSIIFKCTRCVRCHPKIITQKMGDLPQNRVVPSRVFCNSGTDFLGPFLIKPHSLRKVNPIKVYICIFICFSVKAVHLEVVTSLSTEAFIAALTRFVSRRGLCQNLYSDCGTNYVGASTEINKIMKNFLKNKETQKAIERFSNDNQINFHFLPPAAPHQGGLWERTVRSVKHHLHRVIGNQILTLEEFITLSTKIEAILNSRPISPLSSDPSEVDYLTPGHFLIGGPLTSLPEPDWENTPSNRLSRWQLVQAMSQSFWKRWSQEYLHTLQQRNKWVKPQENVKIGDVVVIHEPNLPPLTWKMGRIVETSPGTDGLVRVVKIRTSKGILSRPVTKVSLLPTKEL